MQTDRQYVIRCDTCDKTLAAVQDGTLRILERHNGKWHMTVLTIVQVERILETMRESERTAA